MTWATSVRVVGIQLKIFIYLVLVAHQPLCDGIDRMENQ